MRSSLADAGSGQYGSCPQLEGRDRRLQRRSRKDSVAGSEAASSSGASSADTDDGQHDSSSVSEQERLQVEAAFRSLKTQVYVCGSLANLYLGSTSGDEWRLESTGVPVLLLDLGAARARTQRRIQLVLAERGTCFALWRDTIDNLTNYRVAGRAFHTMHLSSDHTTLVGLSFDSERAADEMAGRVERLTSSPENISLSAPGRSKTSRGRRSAQPPPPPLPTKSHISQPCCFQHITSVEVGDRSRYFSLQTLVPMLSSEQEEPRSEL
ncbi:uncharacterized protein LOC124619320 [Schistocerca americana]|uniref:uncharacterized protein LOC124619320 n=1 Tax=Schistocerca americana TaxID=7009 RepID=UPI001F4FB1A5|nr:uncharacterized protein LOC124619320 [Schistocerca americana]XP_047119378.1 uncharacterized protein LOC124802556 [Schistocerca piceifrons]XP_049763808.1 uncharacterized protein LOC126092318 [Schistocerca cancellata]XP_049789692.1 uncharacterized protein LOC126195216 [Schistocerca nitens]